MGEAGRTVSLHRQVDAGLQALLDIFLMMDLTKCVSDEDDFQLS